MRLILIISSLSAGGAERVVTIMANYWARKDWKITLLTLDDAAKPFYDLDPRVQHIPLGLTKHSPNSLAAVWNNLKRIRVLRRAIRTRKPSCVISFIDQVNVLTLLATTGLKIPVVVDEQSYPQPQRIGRFWELLRGWVYPRADGIVCVTERMLSYFSPRIRSRACVIANPVLLPDPSPERSTNNLLARPALLSVGRLTHEKGYDLLLKAFSSVKDSHPGWTLTILGEGALRHELETLRHQLELDLRVRFLGTVRNIHEYLQQADLFVMASRFEGFPMALCEAMACGLPVISADCPTGPREIIRDGIDGILVPNEDVEALAQAIERLMSDESRRQRLGRRATEVTERFGLEKVMSQWEELLSRTI